MAFAISPDAGSESGAGWAVLKAHLFLGHEVTLLTTSNSVEELKNNDAFNEFKVECVGIPEISLLFKNTKRIPFGFQLRHLMWNLKIVTLVNKILNEKPQTVVHYATFAGDWNLNVLHFLHKSVYKIWGPVGGAQQIPIKLIPFLGILGFIEDMFKRLVGRIFRSLTRIRMGGSRAVVLCANSATKEFFGKSVNVQISQNVVLEDMEQIDSLGDGKLIFGCGRLIPLKNWKLPILAMQYVENKKLLIAGSGPDHKRLQKLIQKHSLEDKVKLIGNIPRSDCLEYISRCDAFVFPSLRDSASWALAEAVALNCRVIALDLPGSAAITQDSGIKLISAHSKDVIKRFADELAYGSNTNNGLKKFPQSKLAEEISESITRIRKI